LGDLRGAGHAAVADSPALDMAGLPAAVADALLVDFRRASSPAMNVAGPLAAVAHALLGPLWDR
jgi:hypothetical protein